MRSNDKELNSMMQTCSSRDDFIVREGPRFAWSGLGSSTAHTKKIGIYVPKGQHRFKYAIHGAEMRGHQTPFTFGDARKLDGAAAVELKDAPQVYEVQLTHNQRGTIVIAPIRPGNEVIHESTLQLIDAPCRLGLSVRAESPAFPSELKK